MDGTFNTIRRQADTTKFVVDQMKYVSLTEERLKSEEGIFGFTPALEGLGKSATERATVVRRIRTLFCGQCSKRGSRRSLI